MDTILTIVKGFTFSTLIRVFFYLLLLLGAVQCYRGCGTEETTVITDEPAETKVKTHEEILMQKYQLSAKELDLIIFTIGKRKLVPVMVKMRADSAFIDTASFEEKIKFFDSIEF
jgi:hypothetical protein